MLNLLRTAAFYFAPVFGAGFLLGTLRVLQVVPAIGTRAAELLEMPLLLAVVGVALRDMTVWQALLERDPVSGSAYYLALGWLATAPWLFARHR